MDGRWKSTQKDVSIAYPIGEGREVELEADIKKKTGKL